MINENPEEAYKLLQQMPEIIDIINCIYIE
jgi:hypothetical protein